MIIATKITIFRLRLHRKFSFYCIQSMFSSVICCSQCHLVSDLQSFFVIVCLETWQNTRGNGSCDTGLQFDIWKLAAKLLPGTKLCLLPDVCQVDIILLTILYLQVDRSSNERAKSYSFSMVATSIWLSA